MRKVKLDRKKLLGFRLTGVKMGSKVGKIEETPE